VEDFEAFVAGRSLALTRFAYLLCGDRYLAEDLVQEVLISTYRRWRRIAERGSPEPYLRTAIVRQLVSWRRRKSNSESPTAVLRDAGRPDHADGYAERDEVWAALAGLTRQQRAVLVLRHYEGLPDAEIAEVLRCRPGTVRVHASRAAATLRDRLPATVFTGERHA
jgi:RNA polymerase sigma-70 factor (sigma-E family)